MNAATSKGTRSLTIAISIMIGMAVTAFAQTASAHGLPSTGTSTYRGPCTYALQLQKSVEAQRRFLVKRDEATGASKATASPEEASETLKTASNRTGEKAGAGEKVPGDLDAFLGL